MSGSTGLEFTLDLLGRVAFLVRSHREHRVDRVGHVQDAGPEWDRASRQAGRIAFAVPPFVMMQDHRQLGPQKTGPFENVHTHRRVPLDQVEFVARQLAGLVEHGIGHADLADVVERGRHLERFDHRRHQTHPLAERFAIGRDVHGMPFGERFLRFHRRDQRPRRLQTRLAKLVLQTSEVLAHLAQRLLVGPNRIRGLVGVGRASFAVAPDVSNAAVDGPAGYAAPAVGLCVGQRVLGPA